MPIFWVGFNLIIGICYRLLEIIGTWGLEYFKKIIIFLKGFKTNGDY